MPSQLRPRSLRPFYSRLIRAASTLTLDLDRYASGTTFATPGGSIEGSLQLAAILDADGAHGESAAADGAAVGSSRQVKGAKKGADGAGAGRSQKVVPFDAIVGKFACLCDGGSA